MLGHLSAHLQSMALLATTKPHAGGIEGWLLHLHGWVVYLGVGGLLFLEVGIVIGFFVPGEIATILGGVMASQHEAQLWIMIPVVVLSAFVGNLSGYAVGFNVGERLMETKLLKDNVGLAKTRDLIARRGGPAVFLGRWVVFVRAVLPGVVGLSDMRFRLFALFSFLGAVVWGTMWVMIGYAAGDSYTKVESVAGNSSLVLLGVAVVAVGIFVLRKRHEHKKDKEFAGSTPDNSTATRP